MDPPVPRPHVPWNEKMAVYSGIFLYVPPMYPYTIDWGLISHVPKVMLMYPSLKLGIGPSCTQSIPHVPTFIETGVWSLLYPSCTPVYFPCILHWDWGSISPVPPMYPLLLFMNQWKFHVTWHDMLSRKPFVVELSKCHQKFHLTTRCKLMLDMSQHKLR